MGLDPLSRDSDIGAVCLSLFFLLPFIFFSLTSIIISHFDHAYLGLDAGLGVLSLLEVLLPGVVSPVEPAELGDGRTGIRPIRWEPELRGSWWCWWLWWLLPGPTRGDSDLKIGWVINYGSRSKDIFVIHANMCVYNMGIC